MMPLWADQVDNDFHARFSVVRKTYRYTLYRGAMPNLFLYRFSWHVPGELSLSAMREAAAHLVGRHDFSSFCASSASQEDKVRTIYRIDLAGADDQLAIEVEGNGFLQYMVRIIVGTLVKVGEGREVADRISDPRGEGSQPSGGDGTSTRLVSLERRISARVWRKSC
ncbi:hypothetical protein GCM10025858_15140 [Alicyclobacillus sacchari]|nr:hypothetical protein GCM10025858_15140 [Alicyclobacillus sacchari]